MSHYKHMTTSRQKSSEISLNKKMTAASVMAIADGSRWPPGGVSIAKALAKRKSKIALQKRNGWDSLQNIKKHIYSKAVQIFTVMLKFIMKMAPCTLGETPLQHTDAERRAEVGG